MTSEIDEESTWTVKNKKSNDRKRNNSTTQANFQKHRPNDSIINDDNNFDDSDDEHQVIDLLENPLFWNKFALIGNITQKVHKILVEHKIYPKGPVMKFFNCIRRISRNITGDYLFQDFDNAIENLNHKIIFLSVIPRFTKREYGKGKTIYMIHIRFNFYLMADTTQEPYNDNFLLGFHDYDGFLGETCTHIPVSDESEESVQNRNNFNNVMKILKDKRKYDTFQPDYEPSEYIILPEKKVTHNSQNNYYKPIPLNDTSNIQKYKCKLILEDAHSGYGEILEGEETGQKIYLHNRRNCSKAFNGDIVEIMKFNSSNEFIKKKQNNKMSMKSIEKNQQHSGRVISVLKSDIKPINKIFLCHLIFGTSNLMFPICNTIPVIYVDNKYAIEQVKKHCKDLKNINAIDIENLVKLTVNKELAEKFANQNFVTVKELDDNLITSVNKIYHVNCYACDFIFLVLYRKWGDKYRFPFGEVVGIYTPDVKFENTLNLIKVTCDIPVIGIDEEKPLQDEIRKIKILRMKEKNIMHETRNANQIIFCFKSLENREFNDIAYSYQINESNEVLVGVHVTNVSKFIQEEGFLDKSAQNRFFSYLIPGFSYNNQNTAQPDYLLSKAISKEFLSINKENATDVISFYFKIDDKNKIIHESVLMEKIILNIEIDAKTADKLKGTELDDNQFYDRIYYFCYSIRSERVKYVIPVQCYFPNFKLKISQSAFIIESELKCLVNKKASIVYERFSRDKFFSLNKWYNDTKLYCNVKWSPLIKLFLCQIDERFNNNNSLDLRLSKQFIDTILYDPTNNLFKCESLFPDIGYYHEQYKLITGSDIIDFFEFDGSTLLSITNPLSCYLDIFAQRIFENLYQNKLTSDSFQEKIDENFLKYKNFKVLHDKYWNICKAYEIKDQFNGISFVLDCVFDNFTEEKFTFCHPFLSEVNFENFIVFKCLRLNKIPLKKSNEGVLTVSLNWKTKVFIQGQNDVENLRKKEIELKDIYSYNGKHFRYENTYANITLDDIKIKNLLDENLYPDQLTSEIIENIDPLLSLSYQIKDRQILRVQFSYDYSSGIMKIVPELLIINPDFRVCLTHSNDPLKYFMHPGELSRINYKRFYKLDEYKSQFIILNRLEGIYQTIGGESHFSIHGLEIDWIAKKNYSKSDDIFGIVILEEKWCRSRFIKLIHKKTNIRDPVNALREAENKNKMDYLLCIQTFLKHKNVYWVGHGRVCDICLLKEEINSNNTNKKKRKNYKIHLTFKLVHSSFPIKNLENQKFFIEFMESPISTRIFERSLRKLPEDSFSAKIVLENVSKTTKIDNQQVDYELIKRSMVLKCDLNEKQILALNKSVNYEFTLIWGPPGTGKTLLGCMIAYWYTLMNKRQPKNPLVLYCGPSNQSVDVVAEKMLKTFGRNCPKLLRIFNSEVTNHDFPYTGMRRVSDSNGCPESLRDIALHYIVRRPDKPFAKNLKDFENKFMGNTTRREMERNEFATELSRYESCLHKAFDVEVKTGQYEIILTTAAGSCKKLLESSNFFQVILDECGMCSEPEALGPTLNKTELKNLVLIGDHKQLRPIVTSQVAKGKQLDISLFERLYKPNQIYCTMLDTQYRMHPSICEFPSFYIYGNKPKNTDKSKNMCLKTILCESWTGIPDEKVSSQFQNFNGLQYVNLYKGYQKDLKRNNINIADEFWGKNGIRKSNFKCYNREIDFSLQSNPVREKILFIHAVGPETDQEISCSTGSSHTKSNELEAEIVRSLYERLIQKIPDKKTASQSILVITQYRLQESNLNDICNKVLAAKRIPGPARVSTVVKSQGTESDYVIFSTVRSLPNVEDIEQNPTSGWISKYLGFITDENQFNVALTRAKKGLFIIGNSYLLSVHTIWKALIDDLKSRKCFKENYLDLL